MLKHRGQIVEKVVRKWCAKNGFTILALSKKLEQAPSTTYRQLEKEELPFHIIKRFGKAMGHDFRVEFPEIEDEENYTVEDSEKYSWRYAGFCSIQNPKNGKTSQGSAY